jgi:SET domain-containing protein
MLKPSKNIINSIVVKKSTIPNAGLGVFATNHISKYTLLDEYKGILITPEQYNKKKSNLAYIWELLDDKENAVGYIDAANKKYSNWTRFVNCPNTLKQENVIPVQRGFKMLYYSNKDIKPGEELFIWYGEEYGKQLTGKSKLD